MPNLLDQNFQKTNIEAMKETYQEFLRELRTEAPHQESAILSDTVVSFIDDVIVNTELNTYGPLKFYWFTLIEKIIYLDSLHQELEETNDEMVEDDIFDFWNKSEYMEAFLELMEEEQDICANSTKLLPMLENQVVSFYYLHISKDDYNSNPLLYTIIPEIGDTEEEIYIGEKAIRYPLVKDLPLFPSIAIKKISHSNGEITLDIDGKTKTITAEGDVPLIEEVQIIPLKKSLDKNLDKITKALEIIKSYAPELYLTFKNFTHTIVPVDEPGIVSYSMQELPGYSCINLFERDFVDLIDDLLHENGHHYLNTILNHEHLINEDDEMIYYSPWRKTRRPIRGIYHAYFTFSWALKLFATLSQSDLNPFNEEEKQKIHKRFCEEYLMMEYCWPDLEHALENEKVEKEGLDILKPIKKEIDNLKSTFEQRLSSLSKSDKKYIESLKPILEKERKNSRF